jgi:hypothetical protein
MSDGEEPMTTPDLKAIEERLNDPFAPVLDGAVEDDIRALLGMVRERDAEIASMAVDLDRVLDEQVSIEMYLAQAGIEAPESVTPSGADRYGRILEMVEDLHRKQSEDVAAQMIRADEAAEKAARHARDEATANARVDRLLVMAEAAEAKLAEVSGQLALIQSMRVAEEEQLVEVTRELEMVQSKLQIASAVIATDTDTFRQIIASASSRLVWEIHGTGDPRAALRAVEALGEAYVKACGERDEAHLRGRRKGCEMTLLDLLARGVIDNQQFKLLSSEAEPFAVNDFGRLVQERDAALSLAKSLRMDPETVSALCVLVDHDRTLAMDAHSHVTVVLYQYAAAAKAKVSDGQ